VHEQAEKSTTNQRKEQNVEKYNSATGWQFV